MLATGSAYIEEIDINRLLKIATSSDLLLRLKHRPGRFIVQGDELAMVCYKEGVNNKLTRQINNQFILSKQRDAHISPLQSLHGDPVYGSAQCRALSPG
ncbi:MAG: hypothetical protein BRC48_07375 [Cyanobacteria bacterium QS_9_48_30]|nr:MAG: hypothetical protein BRC48_07375 [Cyanobacteria bacterium QS_9_48_30]